MNKDQKIWSLVSNYLFPAILIIVSLSVAYWYTWPTIQSIPETKSRVSQLDSEISELKNKQNILSGLNMNELNALVKKADNALPTEKSFAGLLTGLELLALEANSTLLNFDASPGYISTQSSLVSESKLTDTLPNNLQPLMASIGLVSNPASLIDLTSKLSKSSRLITLESVGYNAASIGSTSQNTVIKLNVYFQPASSATVSAQNKLEKITEEEKKIIAEVDSYNRFTLNVPTKFPPRFDPFAPIVQPGVIVSPTASGSSAPAL